MSYMFEVYCKAPANPTKEAAVTSRVTALGGRLDHREEHLLGGVCLTYEFDDREKATKAAEALRQLGEHVEGPMDYAASGRELDWRNRDSYEGFGKGCAIFAFVGFFGVLLLILCVVLLSVISGKVRIFPL